MNSRTPLLSLSLAAGTSLLGFLATNASAGDYVWDNAGVVIPVGPTTVAWSAVNTWNPDGQTPNNIYANAILNQTNAATPWGATIAAGTTLNLDMGASAVTLNSFRQINNGTAPTNPNNVTVNVVGTGGLSLNQIVHTAGGVLQFGPTNPITVNTGAYNATGSLRIVNTDDSATQLQGMLTTAGDVVKDGSGSIRFGTTLSTFTNAVSGNFIINNGTVEFANNTTGNTAGGSGRAIVINGANSTVNLRAAGNLDFVREIDLNSINSTINADRSTGAATGSILAAGTINVLRHDAYLTLSSVAAQSFGLQFDGIALGSKTLNIRNGMGNTAGLDTTGHALLGVLSGNGTLNISGGGGNSSQGMTFNAASPAFTGKVNLFEGGNNIVTATGAFGSGNVVLGEASSTLPITYPNVAVGSSGSPTILSNPWSSRLQYNANNITTGSVTVNANSQISMGVVPNAADVITLGRYGIIQGSSAELGAFGANLILPAADAVISHEVLGGADPAGLPLTASHFFGASANLNGALTVGAGTAWKGVSNDRFARTIGGGATALTVNGGDNDPTTTEATIAAFNGQSLTLLSSVGDTLLSASGQKVTLGIAGYGSAFNGMGAGNAPGGNVLLNQAAATSGLAANVDAINVNSGNLSIGVALGLGGVPVNVNNLGGLDIGGIIGNALDATININSGGTLVLNDATLMTGGAGNPININTGGILHLTGVGVVPANILTASTQPINFTGTNNIVRLGVNNVASVDSLVSDVGAIWEISATGTNTAANAFGTTIGATTINTQSAGLSTNGGGFTNDSGATRFLDAPLTIGNLGATFSATTNLTLALVQPVVSGTGGGAGLAPIQIGSLTAINSITKTENPFLRNNNDDGIVLPHNQSPQVIFTAGLRSGPVNHVTGSFYLDGPAANTAIAGDITMGPNTRLYLGAGGNINVGASFTAGTSPRIADLTPLLVAGTVTTTPGSKIVLGNYSRVEMGLDVTDPAYIASLAGGRGQVNQAFVISGDVNPDDRRSIWVQGTGGTAAADLNNITIRNNGHLALQEAASDLRATVKLETSGTVSPFNAWDFKSIQNVDSLGAPSVAPKTLTMGLNTTQLQPMSLFGAVDQGITLNNVNTRLEIRDGASLAAGFTYNDNAAARSIVSVQNTGGGTGLASGTDHTLSVVIGHDGTANTLGNGTFNINRDNAAGGYVDEIAAGPSIVNTVNAQYNINAAGATLFADRNTDLANTGVVRYNNVAVNAANVSLASRNGTDLEVGTLTVNQNTVVRADGGRTDSNTDNVGAIRVGTVAAAANNVQFQNGRTTITGNVTAGVLTAGGTSLEFNPGSGTSTVSATSVQVNSMLAAKSGTTDFGSALLQGTAVGTTVAGLREGMIAGAAINVGTANPASTGAGANLYSNNNLGIRLDPRIAQNNYSSGGTLDTAAGWGDNQTWVYTGQIFDADGLFSLAEHIDDSVSIKIDGVVVLFNRNSGTASVVGSNAEAANGYTPSGGGLASGAGSAGTNPNESYRQVTSTGTKDGLTIGAWQANSVNASLNGILADTTVANANEYGGTLNFGAGASGWHDVEIRIHNGTGGAASPNTIGFGNYFGLGLNNSGTASLIGTDYSKPVDDGTMNLFRTQTVAKGNVDIDNNATVLAGNLKTIGMLSYGRSGASGGAALNLGGASTGDVDSVNVLATATGTAALNLGLGTTKLITTQLNVADGEVFTLNGAGLGELEITGGAALTANPLALVNVSGGTMRLSNTSGSATGNADLLVNGGTLAGGGITTSSTFVSSGAIAPGNSPGLLTIGDSAAVGLQMTGGTYDAELNGAGSAANGSLYDVLNVNGTTDLGGLGNLSITLGYSPAVGDSFWILLNDGVDPITGTFNGLAEASVFSVGLTQFQITYLADGFTGGGSTLTGGNDVALTVVPEPGSAALAAAGLLALTRRRRGKIA